MCILARRPNLLPTHQIVSKELLHACLESFQITSQGCRHKRRRVQNVLSLSFSLSLSLSLPRAWLRKSESQAGSRHRGGRASGRHGAGERSRSALGSEEPDSFPSTSGGAGRSPHGWQLQDAGAGSTRPWAEAEICTATHTEASRMAELQGWVCYCRVADTGGRTVYCIFFSFFWEQCVSWKRISPWD